MMFNILAAGLLQQVQVELRDLGIAIEVTKTSRDEIFAKTEGEKKKMATDVSFVDDVALMTREGDPEKLVRDTCKTIEVVERVFAEAKLKLNFKRGKARSCSH